MENISKALLIAAAVLIAIILITIGIKVYTSTSDIDKVASSTGKSISTKIDIATDLTASEITGPVTWKYKDNETIINSNGQELKIGDYISYDHTKDKNGNEITESTGLDKSLKQYTDGWQIFGIENGKIQLISSDVVGKIEVDMRSDMSKINGYCVKYSKGKGAETGRSINVKDINNITGYDPYTAENGKPYNYGNLGEYGSKVTYYWDGGDFPFYTDGIRTGYTYNSYSGSRGHFKWWDENGNCNSSNRVEATEQQKEKIVTLTSTFYYYTTREYISSKSIMYKLIGGKNGEKYWLASFYTRICGNHVEYGLRTVSHMDSVASSGCAYSTFGYNSPATAGIRPLVVLSKKTQIIKNSTNDGTSIKKACLIK